MQGRDAALQTMMVRTAGPSGTVTVLHGIGGVGKTRLVLEIGARADEAGVLVWWVQAGEAAAFEDGMRAVGYDAGATRDDFTQANPADVVWQALNRMERQWLLVVDNAEDPFVLSREGPLAEGRGWVRAPQPRGTVLITSRDGRSEAWPGWITCRQLAPLSPQASAEVLLGLAGEAGSNGQARRLGERLSGIPLLLHLAGSALKKAGDVPARWASSGTLRTFIDYQHAIDTNGGGARNTASDLNQLYQRTWEISLDQLALTGLPHGRALLLLICCFADAPLPYEDLLDPVILGGSELLAGIAPAELLQTLRGLQELGLVTLTPGGTSPNSEAALLALHPVIRAAARAHPELASAKNDYWRLATDLLVAAVDRVDGDVARVQTWARLSEHAAEALGHESFHRTDGDRPAAFVDIRRKGSVLRSGGLQLASYGLHAQALLLFDALLRVQQATFDRGDLAVLADRDGRAGILREMGRHDEALAEFDAILPVVRNLLGDQHRHVLTVRYERARVLREMGRHDQALAEFDTILAVIRALHGDQQADVLIVRDARARVLQEMGRHDDALAEFDAVLPALCKLHSDQHRHVLTVRHERARVLREMGRHDQALAEFDAILPALREAQDDRHRDVLAIRHERARVLREMGRHDDALAEFDAILQVRREPLGGQDPDVLATRHERARVLREIGRHDQALAELNDILAVWRNLYGDQHDYVLTARGTRAGVLLTMGRHDDALAEFDAILSVRRALHGDEHGYVLTIRHERARTLSMLKRTAEALSEIEAVVEGRRRLHGADHHRTLESQDAAKAIRLNQSSDPS